MNCQDRTIIKVGKLAHLLIKIATVFNTELPINSHTYGRVCPFVHSKNRHVVGIDKVLHDLIRVRNVVGDTPVEIEMCHHWLSVVSTLIHQLVNHRNLNWFYYFILHFFVGLFSQFFYFLKLLFLQIVEISIFFSCTFFRQNPTTNSSIMEKFSLTFYTAQENSPWNKNHDLSF